jgi:hypothetical protein
MANEKLVERLEASDRIPDDVDVNEFLDEVFTEPQQSTMLRALLADVVDFTPLVGDFIAYQRLKEAQKQGVSYPARPAALENAFSDLPGPLGFIGDVAVAQHTLEYLDREKGIDVSAAFSE